MSVDIDDLSEVVRNATITYNDVCRIKNNLVDWISIRVVLVILYCIIFVTAICGNILVVHVVMSRRQMQTITNIFITNLAISDLMVNFTSLWLTPTYNYIGHWVFGGGLCHGLPLFQGTSIFISTMTLTAIAVDRFNVIVHNSSNVNINDRMSMKTCIAIIVFIWVLSLLLVIPYAVNMKLIYIAEPCNFKVCGEDWKDESFKITYGIIVMVLQFFVPFTIIGYCYLSIWRFLNKKQGVTGKKNEMRRKKRLLTMLITMVCLFAVCWFPFNLLNTLRDLKLDKWIKSQFNFYFLLVHLISMTATGLNPILYAWMNESFRDEFKKAFPVVLARQILTNLGIMKSSDTAVTTAVVTDASTRVVADVEIDENKTNVIPESNSESSTEEMKKRRSIVYLDNKDSDSTKTLLL